MKLEQYGDRYSLIMRKEELLVLDTIVRYTRLNDVIPAMRKAVPPPYPTLASVYEFAVDVNNRARELLRADDKRFQTEVLYA